MLRGGSVRYVWRGGEVALCKVYAKGAIVVEGMHVRGEWMKQCNVLIATGLYAVSTWVLRNREGP